MILPTYLAVNIFSRNITAYDKTQSLVVGRVQTVKEANRSIRGVIQPATDKDIALLSDGAVSEGTLVLHTSSTVSAYDLSQNNQNQRQTYVIYSGEHWRLTAIQNWSDKNGGTNRYILTKSVSIDNDNI